MRRTYSLRLLTLAGIPVGTWFSSAKESLSDARPRLRAVGRCDRSRLAELGCLRRCCGPERARGGFVPIAMPLVGRVRLGIPTSASHQFLLSLSRAASPRPGQPRQTANEEGFSSLASCPPPGAPRRGVFLTAVPPESRRDSGRRSICSATEENP